MNPFILLVSLIVAIMLLPAIAPLFRRKSGTPQPPEGSGQPKPPNAVG